MLVVINLIGMVMLVVIAILIAVTKEALLCCLLAVLWLVYEIAGNIMVWKSLRSKLRLLNSDKRGIFDSFIRLLQSQYESIASREEFFMKQDDNLKSLYIDIREQASSNIRSATAYMETYDYVTRPEPIYLKNLCCQGDALVRKFNALVTQIVDIDTNATTLDTHYIDDVISCMNEMRNL